ncbi:MAG: DUF488 domain-containing protein [Omnitrophica WOR_2 bacterium]
MIQLKRAYEPASKDDGQRILVERLWPRGISKDKANLTAWIKDAAPSPELRKWFNHDPAKWDEFSRRYRAELKQQPEALEQLKGYINKGKVTFVYGARDEQHNSAQILKEYLEKER